MFFICFFVVVLEREWGGGINELLDEDLFSLNQSLDCKRYVYIHSLAVRLLIIMVGYKYTQKNNINTHHKIRIFNNVLDCQSLQTRYFVRLLHDLIFTETDRGRCSEQTL